MDGVFARAGDGVAFVPGPPLADLDVAEVLATVVPRVGRLLARRGLGEGDDGVSAPDAWAGEAPILAGIALIEEAAVIERLLRHLGLPTEIPPPTRRGHHPSRSRPVPGATAATRTDSTRAADRRLVWPVGAHESTRRSATAFAGGPPVRGCTVGQTGAARQRPRKPAG
jgi:hypothetical protein